MGFSGRGGTDEPDQVLPHMVIDADGLNILADLDGWPSLIPSGSVLTPHPGEMARLVNCGVSEVEADRVGITREQAARWRQVIVLKGAHTVVASPDGRVVIQPFANPGLATAGTGDVLAGAIVGLMAQGLRPYEAAFVGAYVHGLAGDLAARKLGTAGMVAGDVLTSMPLAVRSLCGR
jgi:NAD(P)H-hydrate epimerase